MSTWYSKHVEENIWRINNIKCITLVFCMIKSWCTVRETLKKFCIQYVRKLCIPMSNMCKILVWCTSLYFEVQEGIQSFWIGNYTSTTQNDCVLTIFMNIIVIYQHLDQHFESEAQTERYNIFNVCLAPGNRDVFQVFCYKYVATWQLPASHWMYVILLQFSYTTFSIVYFIIIIMFVKG